MGTGSFSGVQSGRGVSLTLHPLLVPRSRKSRAIPLLPLWAVRHVQSLSACTRVHFTFTFTLHTLCDIYGYEVLEEGILSAKKEKIKYHILPLR